MPRSLRSRASSLRRTTGSGSSRCRALVAVACLLTTGGAAYTVAQGDTVGEIAARSGVSISALAQANDLNDPNLIYIGQRLTIPGRDGTADSAPIQPGPTQTHVVRAGESLGTIAARFGLTIEQLAQANGITDPSRIMAGSLLRIARDAPPSPGGASQATTGTHVIRSGESLSTIASRYGTSVASLADANGLPDPDRIIVGQQLTVPSGGSTWTCPWSGSRSYVNDFGVPKPDGRFHEGVDVYAPDGSEILAPVSGTVEQVTGSRAGKQFTLHGDDGYTYIGSHLSSFGSSGRVVAGEAIGTVGSSGNARGVPAQTHFEMHIDGVVNPYPTLQQYCG